MYSLLIVSHLAFVCGIAFYNPQKQSLRDTTQTSLPDRILSCKGTLLLGTLLTGIALLTFNLTTGQIVPMLGGLFGYSRQGFFEAHLYFQPLTCIFIHGDVIHLVANLSALALMSAYERRVGFLRYLTVFLVSSIAASLLDILFVPSGVVSLGASGGIFGLIAGYILDRREAMSTKAWLKNSALVLFLVLVLSFLPQSSHTQLNVNWIAHLLGAACAALLIRLFSLQENPEPVQAASLPQS